jgi:hypothetical protein
MQLGRRIDRKIDLVKEAPMPGVLCVKAALGE